jgi:hypothetical protein
VVPGTGAIVGSPLPPVPARRFIALMRELLPAGAEEYKVCRAAVGRRTCSVSSVEHDLAKELLQDVRQA